MDLKLQALKLHKKAKGKIEVNSTIPVKDKKALSLVYTPGVGMVSMEVYKSPELVWDVTIKGRTVAVITDGSAVLGLGNIGPEAALPVMEGKCVLFKTFAGIDAFPICLNTQDPQEIIQTVKAVAPTFGGINLEDISAPRCFEIEEALQDLGIPVMHDDQHGTSVVVLAGLINAAKVAGKDIKDLKVALCGAGAAGQAVAKLLSTKVKDTFVLDSKGIVSQKRDDLDMYKKKLLQITNKEKRFGGVKEALAKVDVFIGVSKPGVLTVENIKSMNKKPIIFALANPTPEIMYEEAKKGGAYIIATGRSDFPNQINNSLAFPGIFKGALSVRAPRITEKMKIAAAEALAKLVKKPTPEKIIPGPFDKGVVQAVAKAVARNCE